MDEQKWSKQLHHFYGIYDLPSSKFQAKKENSMHLSLFTMTRGNVGVQVKSDMMIENISLRSDKETTFHNESRNIYAKSNNWITGDHATLSEVKKLSLYVSFRLPLAHLDNDGNCTCRPDPNFTFLLKPSPPSPPPPTSLTLSANLASQFLREDNADVWFVIGDEVIPAHKFILMARVEVFEKMFSTKMQEADTNRITIDDTDSQTFKRMLKFIYCGEFPEDLDSTADILLPLTEKYDIRELKDACVSTLKAGMNKDNSMQTMILADLYRCPDLLERCAKYLAKQALDEDALEPLKAYPHLLIKIITVKNC